MVWQRFTRTVRSPCPQADPIAISAVFLPPVIGLGVPAGLRDYLALDSHTLCMDTTTFRNRDEPVDPEVYWRRRVLALAGGLAILGLLAWAVGGATATRPAASTSSVNGSGTPGNIPLAAPSPTVSTASPTPPASSTSPSPSPSPSHTQTKQPAHRVRRASMAGMNAPGDDCPADDVVISMSAGSSYAGSARPQFGINVVSTDSRTCAFNVGPRYLTVTVRSGGVRAWGSGDCVRGGGTQVVHLSRGVPTHRTITWDRILSTPGCRPRGSTAQPGTYTAVATDAGLHTQTLVFILRS